MSYRMAIDVGTLSTRAVLFDAADRIVFQQSRSLDLFRPSDLRVEQDGEQLVQLTSELVTLSRRYASDADVLISAAAIATQRSSVVAWRRSDGMPLSPILSWQDRRTQDWLMQQSFNPEWLFQRTGLPLSAHYGASKLRWIRDNLLGDDLHDVCMGPLAAFLLNRLTDERRAYVDATNASRMQLVALSEPHAWDETLLEAFGLKRAWLPEILPARSNYGHLGSAASSSLAAVPVRAVCGDQFAAMHAMALADGEALLNLGTGGFLMLESKGAAPDRLLRSPGPDGGTLIEATINGVGAALEWAAAEFGVGVQSLPWEQWSGEVANSNRWRFENRIGGLGSPWWQPAGRCWTDIAGCEARPTNVRDAMVAVAESIAAMVAINVASIREAGVPIDRLRVTGGVSRIQLLVDRIAFHCDCPALVAETDEATALGAVRLLSSPADDAHTIQSL